MINKEKFYKKRVLFGILDWGLGHTTRSIPLIRFLQDLGMEVIVACNSTQKNVLEQELHHLRYLPLEGYHLRYGSNAAFTKLQIAFQSINILTKIKSENRWIKAQMNELKPDIIISDNRYGFRHTEIPSILITHQLLVKTGTGLLADNIMKMFLRSQFKHFNSCWVPDWKEAPGLAGELSHPSYALPCPIRYIGAISRLEFDPHLTQNDILLVLLSGPEPQRSLLEERLSQQLSGYTKEIVIVRGKPEGGPSIQWPAHATVYDHLPMKALQEQMQKARYIISRSGYTTLMDIFKLQKKLIAIPTPGQAEQEYLGHLLHEQQQVLCIEQSKFQWQEALKQAEAFPFLPQKQNDFDAYKQVIAEELDRLLH